MVTILCCTLTQFNVQNTAVCKLVILVKFNCIFWMIISPTKFVPTIFESVVYKAVTISALYVHHSWF
jgi:hypothetical protein